MPLVSLSELLNSARREGYGVGYFEAWDSYSLEAALEAAGELAEAQRALGLSTSEFYRRIREIRYRLFTIGLVDRRSLLDRELLGKASTSTAT